MNNPEPEIDVARGDIGMSRYLQQTLKLLADSSTDPDLNRQIREISSGRASLHSILEVEGFNTIIDRALSGEADGMIPASDAERERLAAAGEVVLERFRNLPAGMLEELHEPGEAAASEAQRTPEPTDTYSQSRTIPGTRKPNRDFVVSPDEPDDDDAYFQERGNRGWLV